MHALSKTLINIAHSWLDTNYILRQRAIKYASKEFCLSEQSFELTLNWMFEQWEKWLTHNTLESPFPQHQYAVQILASNSPAMITQGFFQGAILNKPHCLKVPREQTIFAHLLYQSLIAHSPSFNNLFDLDNGEDLPTFYKKLSQADLVIAYGHDETLSHLQNYISPNATFIAHGHTESAAIIFSEATNILTLEKLADDMLSYDQRGCLSPRVTFIEAGGELSPSECAQTFAEMILPRATKRWPRGRLLSGEAAEIFHQRILYKFRGTVYTGSDWTICYDDTSLWPEITLPRFMIFKPLLPMIESMAKHSLMQIGYAGSNEKMAKTNKKLHARLCPIGEMQKQLLVF